MSPARSLLKLPQNQQPKVQKRSSHCWVRLAWTAIFWPAEAVMLYLHLVECLGQNPDYRINCINQVLQCPKCIPLVSEWRSRLLGLNTRPLCTARGWTHLPWIITPKAYFFLRVMPKIGSRKHHSQSELDFRGATEACN